MEADIPVVLDQIVVILGRTEIILEGRFVTSANAEVGMIAPFSSGNNPDNSIPQ